MSNLEILWETYDFILNKIVRLEDEFCHIMDVESPQEDEEKLKPMTPTLSGSGSQGGLKKTCTKLNNSYGKQILTIRELRDFYEKNPADITEERRVAIEAFEELEEVTVELKEAVEENYC